MFNVALKIPDEIMYDTKMNKEDTNRFAMRAVALAYYTQRGVSIGYCSQIAGMTEEYFIRYLGANHITIFHYDNKEEFMEELENA